MKKAQEVKSGQLLTIAQVMALLQVSRPTLYRWMEEGLLPWVQFPGARRFRAEDLERFLSRNTVQ